MKIFFKIIIFLFWIGGSIYCNGQRSEVLFQIYSGDFSYGGIAATDSTHPESMNPYGKTSGFSYGTAFKLQWVSKTNLVAGFEIGYQSLSSKVETVLGHNGTPHSGTIYREYGEGTLTFNFITFNTFLSKRFSTKNIDFDLTGGIELGFSLVKGKLDVTNHNYRYYELPLEVPNPPFDLDVRPFIQISGYYSLPDQKNKLGLSVGYFYGISNYADNNYSPPLHMHENGEVYSRMWRFGLVYKILLS